MRSVERKEAFFRQRGERYLGIKLRPLVTEWPRLPLQVVLDEATLFQYCRR
ncbi:hypothetical protein KCP71_02445 [Salmonella enterica subsp. enterica]|nr:hypothetical protein KCP71_02445 [Salmonella enterica subsp. enterica]